MRLPILLALAVVIAFSTLVLGWWGVPLCAALVTAVSLSGGGRAAIRGGDRSPALGCALAASLAWGGLLALDAAGGRVDEVARLLAGILPVPAAGLIVVTLLFPALLAWSAAALVEGLLAPRTRRTTVAP